MKGVLHHLTLAALLQRFRELDLQKKFFVSILLVIMAISGTIALLARWILVSGLTDELEMRGTAIAHSVAARGSGYILDANVPQLVGLIFDEIQLRERNELIAYIYVADAEGEILAHTFIQPFPQWLKASNRVPAGSRKSVRLLEEMHPPAYDIAVPVNEGLYTVGEVHVGLNKIHMDSLVGKLRVTFLGFITAVVVITFIITHFLARYITAPVARLTRISDDLSRGDFTTAAGFEPPDAQWKLQDCPAYADTDLPCWHFDEQRAKDRGGDKLHRCATCVFYRKRGGDEVSQLADSFRNMVWSIQLYRRRLQESEGKYRSLFDSGPDPIFVVDCTNYRILDANPRAVELYGYTRDELLNLSFDTLGGKAVHECTAMLDGEETTSGCAHLPKVTQIRKDGTTFFVNMHACPISYRGRPAIIASTTDISEMMEKDAQIVQAAKMKSLGEMSAGVAHEINQPLNAIRMGCDFMAMALEQGLPIPPEQLRDVARDVCTQVDRATEIINTLRAFGRKSDIRDEPVDLNDPIRAVLLLLEHQFLILDVEFTLELAPSLPPVRAHGNRLQQVVFNLVTNARDAILQRMQSTGGLRGRITIRTEQEGDQVLLSIADNGAGIPEHLREQVFHPFFTTKATGEGMGLGLAIVYGIVRDYGGEIRIDSTEGKGTTCHLRFPAERVTTREV